MTVTPLIPRFKAADTIEARKAKILRINAITEELALMITHGDQETAQSYIQALEAAGVEVSDADPTLWQAEVVD